MERERRDTALSDMCDYHLPIRGVSFSEEEGVGTST